MEEVNNKELVTKGLLLAFGTRCKEWFKINPVRIVSLNGGQWICVKTSLKYNDSNLGFDRLYVDVKGISTNTTLADQLLLNSHFIFTTDILSKIINFGSGINLGTDSINAVILGADTDNNLWIYIQLKDNRIINDCLVDVAAYLNDKLVFKIVIESDCFFASDITIIENLYEQIAISDISKPKPRALIGSITNLLQEETAFDLVINKSGGTIIVDSYTKDKQFEKIYESTQSTQLTHGLKFLYDWDTKLDKDDNPVDVTNGQLIEGTTVKIPIPDLLQGGATGTGNLIEFKDGIATNILNVSTVPRATTTTRGGIFLNDNSSTCYGDKIWVQLDEAGTAFIDKGTISEDRHRGDLSSDEFANPASFAGQIWQHIGETTESFVNGYFYKSVKFGYTYTTTETNTPYAIGTQIASKFEKYLTESGSTLNLDKPFKLYVDPVDFNTTKQIEDPEHPGQYITVNATFEDLKVFKIINVDTPTNILTLTKELLFTVLDTLMADNWKEQLTKDYTSTIMTLTPIIFSADEYKWRLWDVQPRSGSGSLFEYITNEEIDVLFEIHVEDIIISGNNHGAKGSSITLTCEIKPIKTPHKEVTWTVNDSTKATVTPVTNNTAIVIIAAAAESGDEIEVICTSTYDPEISKTFKITVD